MFLQQPATDTLNAGSRPFVLCNCSAFFFMPARRGWVEVVAISNCHQRFIRILAWTKSTCHCSCSIIAPPTGNQWSVWFDVLLNMTRCWSKDLQVWSCYVIKFCGTWDENLARTKSLRSSCHTVFTKTRRNMYPVQTWCLITLSLCWTVCWFWPTFVWNLKSEHSRECTLKLQQLPFLWQHIITSQKLLLSFASQNDPIWSWSKWMACKSLWKCNIWKSPNITTECDLT